MFTGFAEAKKNRELYRGASTVADRSRALLLFGMLGGAGKMVPKSHAKMWPERPRIRKR